MNYENSSKRFKSANGMPVSINRAANLPAYQSPAMPGSAVAGRGAPVGSISGANAASASVDRSGNGNKPGLRLTVKAPPSKLRNATSSSTIPPNPYASESDATPVPPTRSARSTRDPKAILEPDSDDVDEDAEGEDEDMDVEAEDDEQPIEDDEDDEEEEDEEEEEEEEDAEGEEDEAMEDHPPPPVIEQTKGTTGKPNVTVTAPPEGPLKSVEAKEMDEDDDDDELSELDDNDLENPNEEVDDEDDSDEDDELSRSATPDLSKLTRRQRGLYEENESADLMALSNEAQKKKHLSAEEHAMRRQEMARRRKNLSERRNEEEKMDTINKLLKKPAPKRRTRAEIIAAQQAEAMGTPGYEDGEEERPDALFTRYVENRQGARLGVPEEWMEAPVGDVFRKNGTGGGRMMVEEVA